MEGGNTKRIFKSAILFVGFFKNFDVCLSLIKAKALSRKITILATTSFFSSQRSFSGQLGSTLCVSLHMSFAVTSRQNAFSWVQKAIENQLLTKQFRKLSKIRSTYGPLLLFLCFLSHFLCLSLIKRFNQALQWCYFSVSHATTLLVSLISHLSWSQVHSFLNKIAF